MDDNNIKKIKVAIKEEITESEKRLKQGFGEEIAASEKRLKQGFGEEIAAAEQRLEGKISESKQNLEGQIKQLSRDIGDLVEDQILPMIGQMARRTDLERVERKVDKLVDSSLDHESRITAIEEVPTTFFVFF